MTASRGVDAPDRHWPILALLIAATVLTAALGGFAAADAKAYYASLAQPAWAPPAAVFAPVWTLLYAMMGTAAWLVLRRAGWPAAAPALRLYLAQLALNALWTWLFFHWHTGAGAFAEVLVLLAAVALTARRFGRVRPLAGALLLPYLAWVAFASALTWSIWQLNPGAL